MKRTFLILQHYFLFYVLFLMAHLFPLSGYAHDPNELQFPQPAIYLILDFLHQDIKSLVAMKCTCRYIRDKVGKAPKILHKLECAVQYTAYLKEIRKNSTPPLTLPEQDRLDIIHGLFEEDEESLEQKHVEPFTYQALQTLRKAFTPTKWQKLPPFYKIEHEREHAHQIFVRRLFLNLRDLTKKGTISDTHYQNCLAMIATYPFADRATLGAIESYVLTLDHCPPKGLLLGALSRNSTQNIETLLDYIDCLDGLIGNHEDHDIMVGESLQAKVMQSILECHHCCGTHAPICPVLQKIHSKVKDFQPSERIDVYVCALAHSQCSIHDLSQLISDYLTVYQTHLAPNDGEIITHFDAILHQANLTSEHLDRVFRSFVTVYEQQEKKLRHTRTSLTLLPETEQHLRVLFLKTCERFPHAELHSLLKIYMSSTAHDLDFQKDILCLALLSKK